MTHYSNAGQQRVANLAIASGIPALIRAKYSITASNASGTSAPATLQVAVTSRPPAALSSGLIQ